MLNYLYKSEDLENALRAIFGDEEKLFGCPPKNRQAPNKVAIVAIGQEDAKPSILANYNREWLMDDDESTLFAPIPLLVIF